MSPCDQIIDKIKKLLRMKRGGTAAEVETALALAAKLAAEHGIDIESVNPDDEKLKSDLGHDDSWIGANISREAKYAASLIQQFFNVDVFFRRACSKRGTYGNALVFVGRAFEIEIAIYIFRFVLGHFRRSWRNRPNRRIRSRRSFIMYCGIKHKLEEERPPQSLPFALAESRAAYIDKSFGALVKIEPSKRWAFSDNAANQGYIAGRSTEFRKAVQKPTPLQLP